MFSVLLPLLNHDFLAVLDVDTLALLLRVLLHTSQVIEFVRRAILQVAESSCFLGQVKGDTRIITIEVEICLILRDFHASLHLVETCIAILLPGEDIVVLFGRWNDLNASCAYKEVVG